MIVVDLQIFVNINNDDQYRMKNIMFDSSPNLVKDKFE